MSSETDINWPRIILIYALGVFAAMAVSQTVPFVGMIAGELHPQSQLQFGLIISLPSLVVALGALPVGWIVDRTGAKPVLIAGAVILALGDGAAVLASSIQALLTARVIEGAGYVGMAVAAVTLLSRTTSGTRRLWSLALWSSFVPMSFVVPFLTSGPIFAAHNWRLAFEYHAVVLLLLTLAAALLLPRGTLLGEGARSKGLGLVLKSPWPWVLGISFGAAACVQSGIVATLNSYWPAHFHKDATNVPLNSAIGMVINIVGCLLVGRLISFKIPVWVIGIAGSVIAAVSALTMFLAPLSYSAEVYTFWVFTFGCGLLVGMWVLLPRVAPSPAATGATSGLVTSLTLLGVLIGSPAAFSVVFAPVAAPIIIFVVGSIVVGLIALPIWLGRVGTSHA